MTETTDTPSGVEPTTRARRGKARQPSAETLVATTSLLPRRRMAVTGSAPAAADVEAVAAKKRVEAETIYRQLLGAAAEHAEPSAVAVAMNWSEAALDSFLTEHKQFATDRYEKVRKRHTVTAATEPAPASDFIWTDAKRQRLLEKYVDRGDLLEAQEHVGCTPSQFNRERESNPEFRRLVEAARKEARETLKLRATTDALGGNDKLLSILFKDLESEKTDNDLSKLTDAQLYEQCVGIVYRIRERLVQSDQCSRLDVVVPDLLIGTDITLLLQVVATALKSTGSHEGAAASIGRTVAEFDEFLSGCEKAGLTAEVRGYHDIRAGLDPRTTSKHKQNGS
jgi:hypothetical protein